MDHAPGPSIATPAVSTAKKMSIKRLSGFEELSENAIHNSSIAMSAPITGVHKPASRKIPPAASMKSRATVIGAPSVPNGRLTPR